MMIACRSRRASIALVLSAAPAELGATKYPSAINEAVDAFAKQVGNDSMFATRVHNYLVKRGLVKELKPKGRQRQVGLWPTSGGKYITEALFTSKEETVKSLSDVLRKSWDDEMAGDLHDLGLKWQLKAPVKKKERPEDQGADRYDKPAQHEGKFTDVKAVARQLVRTLQDQESLLSRVDAENVPGLAEALEEERRLAVVEKKRVLVDRADAALQRLRRDYPEMNDAKKMKDIQETMTRVQKKYPERPTSGVERKSSGYGQGRRSLSGT